MSRYGGEEYRYARPIAEGLVQNASFGVWLLEKTRFGRFARAARLLHEEQKARRTPQAENWWRSYWTTDSSCACGECGERETDLLAIFEAPEDYRFALHVEVKSPRDHFGREQAKDYGRRATCWKGRDSAPPTVLPHDDATTLLACESDFVDRNRADVELFDAVVTFEEITDWLSPYPDPE